MQWKNSEFPKIPKWHHQNQPEHELYFLLVLPNLVLYFLAELQWTKVIRTKRRTILFCLISLVHTSDASAIFWICPWSKAMNSGAECHCLLSRCGQAQVDEVQTQWAMAHNWNTSKMHSQWKASICWWLTSNSASCCKNHFRPSTVGNSTSYIALIFHRAFTLFAYRTIKDVFFRFKLGEFHQWVNAL